MGALTMGIASGLLTAGSGIVSGLANSASQRQQASSMEKQAQQMRQQSELARQQGMQKQRQIDRQKNELSRQYRALQSQNQVSVASGNVDASSGSALKAAEGNINLYADDVGENAYNRVLNWHETNENMKQLENQAEMYDAQSSSLKQTANSMVPTLVTSMLNGALSGVTAYNAAGGTFFKDGWKTPWDEGAGETLLKMRHPSGKWTDVAR